MALQGSLSDFSTSEILQLLGTQQKSGCLILERGQQRVLIYVIDGRIVSTRDPGLAPGDPLLEFLIKVQRLSADQRRGIETLQQETGRDLEDILVNGRYVDAEDFENLLHRQILDRVTLAVPWTDGTYRFESRRIWEQPARVQIAVEGALIEAARRIDEQQRFGEQLNDSQLLLGVRDLPDPTEPLTDEERDLFGLIDGRTTLDEIVAQVPLTRYETLEAIDRLMRMEWVEVVGRRDVGPEPEQAEVRVAPTVVPVRRPVQRSFASEMAVTGVMALGIMILALIGFGLRRATAISADDVFVAAQLRDLRYALDLYRLEHGTYPARIEDLAADRWVRPEWLRVPGHDIYYDFPGGSSEYEVRLERHH